MLFEGAEVGKGPKCEAGVREKERSQEFAERPVTHINARAQQSYRGQTATPARQSDSMLLDIASEVGWLAKLSDHGERARVD